jgi:rod shape determining protein RodA
MARRSWRNFDYLLLGALLILSAYGVIMIYSATINTLGLENPVQRQIIYIVVGTVILLITASVDYHLLEVVQYPFAILTPFLLGMANIVLVITWRMGQTPDLEVAPTFDLFKPDLPAMLLGIALVAVVFLVDRFWIKTLDLVLSRLVVAVLVVVAATAGAYILNRLSISDSFLWVCALAVVYMLDCLTLRFADALHNPVYVFVLGLLGAVFVAGQVAGGAQRWLGAGAVQPSELSKILIIVVLAKLLADREERMDQFSTVIVSLGIAALPMILIYLQPDLGTALTFVAIWVAMVWMAGTRFRHLLVLAGGGVAALPLVWLNLETYMRQRLLLFVSPTSDPDSYFNVHQALVSIGSGGWTGKGLTQGTQSQLHFLRVRHTDFIFAVTAEELGFLGAVAMMGLIVFILWRILRIADRARDPLGRLIATGVAAIILFQSVVNIGMNLGLMPVTGIPLPFVSYGGSSFVTLMLGMGLVQSVAMRHKKLEFD